MAGTPAGSDTTTNSDGLVQGHAYNILDILELSNGQRLVKMQNPWSSESFHGDWSDESGLWTDELKAEANWTSADDGVFFMSFEDYFSQCSETYFNYDVSDWFHDSFLKLDDQT
jgi:hypothetical protein